MSPNYSTKKEKLEVERLEAEIAKLKTEQKLFSQRQELEFYKLQEDIKKVQGERKLGRIWGPVFLQLIPGLAIATITLVVASKNDFFSNQHVLDQIHVARAQDTLKIYNDRKDSAVREYTELKKKKESLEIDYNAISVGYANVLKQIDTVVAEKHSLEKENKFLVYGEYLKLLKTSPYTPFDRMSDLENKITVKDSISQRIVDTLKVYTGISSVASLSSYILFHALKKHIYLDKLKEQITKHCQIDYGTLEYTVPPERTKSYVRLLEVLNTNRWTIEEQIEISGHVINTLKEKMLLNAFTFDLLKLPAMYNSQRSLQLENKDIGMVADYLEINNHLLHLKAPVNPLPKSVEDSLASVEKYTRYIGRKKIYLISMSSFCPQFCVAYLIKYGSSALKHPWAYVSTSMVDEDRIAKLLIEDLPLFPPRITNLLTEKVPDLFANTYQTNLRDLTNRQLLDGIDYIGPVLEKSYQKYKNEVDIWASPNPVWIIRNTDILKKRVKDLSF